MQKVQKLVINSSFIILLLISFKTNAQVTDEDYLLLNKVIDIELINNNQPIFKLNELARSTNSKAFKNYYRYKFLKEKTFTMLDYDESNDTIKEINDNERVEREKSLYSKYAVLDKVLTKEDFLQILNAKVKTKWDSTKLIGNNDIVKIDRYPPPTTHSGFRGGYFISIPYYSIDKNYALISFSSSGTLPKLYIFKRKNNKWIKYAKIDQFFL